MRIALSVVGFLIFTLFTYWQTNDADHYGNANNVSPLWVCAYASMALLSAACGIYQVPTKLFWTAAAIPYAIALFRFSFIDWHHDNLLYNPDNPAANETAGLIIMVLWTLAMNKVNKTDAFC